MNEVLRKDLKIKLLSISFALLLWIFVVNSIDPPDTKTINVQLDIKNVLTLQEKNLSINNPNYQKVVTIKVRGRRDALKNVNESSFVATLDFSKVESEADTKLWIDDVRYIGSESIKIESMESQYVTLELKKIGKNTFPVEVVADVETKPGYVLYDKYTDPGPVTVEGEASSIELIDKVVVNVEKKDLDKNDVVYGVECKALDKNGKEISSLRIPTTVDVYLKVAKQVAIVPDITGKPAENFIAGTSMVSPEKVMVTADDALILDGILSIKTEKIDIDNASSNVNEKKGLVPPPEGVRFVNPPTEVTVTVVIEPLAEKEFNISGNSIAIINANIVENLTYSIVTESLIINVKGEREQLGSLYISDLKPFINVEGLNEGNHEVPVQVILNGISKLVEEYKVEVKVEKSQAAAAG